MYKSFYKGMDNAPIDNFITTVVLNTGTWYYSNQIAKSI